MMVNTMTHSAVLQAVLPCLREKLTATGKFFCHACEEKEF